MTEELLALAVALKELKCLSVETLAERLLIQKKMYLLQESGTNFGFIYNWYLKGPYCPYLTEKAYDITQNYNLKEFEQYTYKDVIAEKIEKINQMGKSESFIRSKLEVPDWYELLASIHYLFKKNQIKDKQKNKEDLLKYKPKYCAYHFDCAWEELIKTEFVN